MKDKLEWSDMGLMDYIAILETLYIPDIEEYNYRMNVNLCPASQEAISDFNDAPFGATTCMMIFRNRHNQGEFKRLSYEKYVNDSELQQFITDLGLDRDKLWLLTLFTLDYCETMFLQGVTMKLNPLEQLQQLVTMIDQSADDTMTLNFRAGKLKATIDDPHALRFIANAIAKCADEADEETIKYLSRRIEAEESTMLKDSPLIAYFAKMLLAFFNTQTQIREKRKKGAKHSIKETDLVCQLIYFTRLSNAKSWLMTENENLKAYLKQYKNYEYPNNISSVYPEFIC